MGDGEGD